MAFKHGKNTNFTIDGNDLSGATKTSELGRTADTHDVTAYGNDDKAYIPGLKDSTFSAGGTYADGATGPKAVLEPLIGGDAVTLVRQAEGAGSGLPQESVSILVTSYVETNPVDGAIEWAAEFQGSGPIDTTPQA